MTDQFHSRAVRTCDLASLVVWDLALEPTEIWSTTVEHIESFHVHPTPEGLGIRIFTYSHVDNVYDIFHHLTVLRQTSLCIFEIYPPKDILEDAKVAELALDLLKDRDPNYFLYGNRAVIYARDMGIVIVWDFIAKHYGKLSILLRCGSKRSRRQCWSVQS